MIVAPACIANAIEDALAPLGRPGARAAPAAVADPRARRGGAGMKTRAFEYSRAAHDRGGRSRCSAEHGDEAKVLAGGQSLVPMLAMRLARPAQLVDVNEVDAWPASPTTATASPSAPLTRERDGRAVVARRRAGPGARRGAAAHRPRRDPQPRHHRRQHRPRRRVGRAARGRGGHRGRDGRASRARRAGRARRRLLRRALHDRPSTTTSCSSRSGCRPGPPARAGRSTRSPVATATSRSSASPPWSTLDRRPAHRRGPHRACSASPTARSGRRRRRPRSSARRRRRHVRRRGRRRGQGPGARRPTSTDRRSSGATSPASPSAGR